MKSSISISNQTGISTASWSDNTQKEARPKFLDDPNEEYDEAHYEANKLFPTDLQEQSITEEFAGKRYTTGTNEYRNN